MYCLHGCVTSLVHMLINLAEFVCFASISVVYSCYVFCHMLHIAFFIV